MALAPQRILFSESFSSGSSSWHLQHGKEVSDRGSFSADGSTRAPVVMTHQARQQAANLRRSPDKVAGTPRGGTFSGTGRPAVPFSSGLEQ